LYFICENLSNPGGDQYGAFEGVTFSVRPVRVFNRILPNDLKVNNLFRLDKDHSNNLSTILMRHAVLHFPSTSLNEMYTWRICRRQGFALTLSKLGKNVLMFVWSFLR
jgi:hypothetical protein